MTQEPQPGDDEAIQDADEVPDPPNDEVKDDIYDQQPQDTDTKESTNG